MAASVDASAAWDGDWSSITDVQLGFTWTGWLHHLHSAVVDEVSTALVVVHSLAVSFEALFVAAVAAGA